MQQHPVTGSEIVRDIDFLGAARDVIRSHHERWDGGGYPDGLAGKDIPVSARVFAVADTLDALTTRRPYREPSTIAVARTIIDAGRGTHFDPEVIDAFHALPDAEIEQIRARIGG
jgi:response regulator RpfG family c-di-GMP phosphodiesterase